MEKKLSDRKGGDDRSKSLEKKLRELEAKLQDENNENSELSKINQRLADELGNIKNQHQKDLEDVEFTGDQTRKKYQGMSDLEPLKCNPIKSISSRTCATQ